MLWPLVGRADELAHLRRQLADPNSHGVVIAGPAGTGKTRLATECLDLAHQSERNTARVMASRALSGVPFGALAQLLPTAPTETEDRAGILRAAARALVGSDPAHRLVLLVDDAQLLDDMSAAVVHQLAATTDTFVLATVRAGERTPEAITALWKDGLVERLELDGLSESSVEVLLGEALGAQVDPAATAAFTERSRGNVLYLRELVLGATRDGSLREQDGLWRLDGALAPSDRLVEIVEARLSGLDGPERALLELVSFGEPLGAAELAALSGASVAERLEDKSLISSAMDGRRLQLRLAHPLYGDVLRARVPATRAQKIARLLAEIVEATGARRRGDSLRVASWRLTGGGGTAELMMEAAISARWHYDWELAERLAVAARQAGAGFEAILLLAQLASLRGRTAKAEQLLSELVLLAADDDQRRRVAHSRLDNMMFGMRPADGLKLAEEAESTIEDSGLRDEITARRAWLLVATEGPAAGIDLIEDLVHRSSGAALAWAGLGAAYCLTRLGRLTDALTAARRGHEAHQVLSSPAAWYPWWHLYVRCEALRYGGQLAAAESLACEQHSYALTERSLEAQAYFACQLARVSRERGRVKTSIGYSREAVALFRRLDRPMFIRDALQDLALAAALAGDPEEAATALDELTAMELLPYLHTGVELVMAHAWTSAARGDLGDAADLFTRAAELGQEVGDVMGAVESLHALARIGRARGVASRLADLCAHVDGDLAAARARHVTALARQDGQELDTVSASFESLGADLLAAEAAADSAVAWRAAGERRRSAAAGRRMIALVDRCEGATTPSLQSVTARAMLAPAERETAMLAAAGASNKQIADQLRLGVRSIENRLQRVYEKLGISGRGELAAALDDMSAD